MPSVLSVLGHVHVCSKPHRKTTNVDDACVCCRKSTKGKKHHKCKMSSDAGGKICDKCFVVHPDKHSFNCHVWSGKLGAAACALCTRSKGKSLHNCKVCNLTVCNTCTARNSFLPDGSCAHPVCNKCLPDKIIRENFEEANCDTFCDVCLSHHNVNSSGQPDCPYNGSSTPPLVNFLRNPNQHKGFTIRASQQGAERLAQGRSSSSLR